MASQLRYVCLSDLHLGSSRSLLSAGPPGRTDQPSEVLHRLVACLRSLADASAGERPVLVLNGDVLELALASDEISARAFQHFMELVMAPGDELFSDVWFVPGNHDHHLWEAAREQQYADYLARHLDAEIPHPWFSTRALREHDSLPVASPLLTTLLRRARNDAIPRDVDAAASWSASVERIVSASYPNLALVSENRCVVFHHGHFIEPAYRLLTRLNTALFEAPVPPDVNALEEGNFAWIDFFWSALGRTGGPGQSIQYVYDHLRDPAKRDELVNRLARNIARLIRNRTPWDGFEDEVQARILDFVLTEVAEWADTLGRQAYYGGTTAVGAHDRGLEDYLGTYVRAQLAKERPGELPSEVTFVFGHTHHPLVRRAQPAPGFPQPVRAYNTGGWVHETPALQPQTGASIVAVSADLDTVAIELYREIEGLARRYPRVQSAGLDGHRSEFHRSVAEALAGDSAGWKALSLAIEQTLAATPTRAEGLAQNDSQGRCTPNASPTKRAPM